MKVGIIFTIPKGKSPYFVSLENLTGFRTVGKRIGGTLQVVPMHVLRESLRPE